jgi:hypothetical protein
MPRKVYTAEHHEQAFYLYQEYHTFSAVAEVLNMDLTTISRWSRDSYDCAYPGCVWHGWDRLVEEKDRAVESQLQLYDKGILSPTAHDQAIREAVDPDAAQLSMVEARKLQLEVDRRRRVMEKLVRSDFERLSQWEFIWSKVIFHVTGEVLDFESLVGKDGDCLSVEDMREHLSRGLKLTTLEAGIRALKDIQKQIEYLKEKIGVQKKFGDEEIGTEQTEPTEERPQLSMEDIRNFQELLRNTPPEQQAVLIKMVQADENALRLLSNEQGDSGVSESVGSEDSVPLPPTG